MASVVKPKTEAELQAAIASTPTVFRISGSGTKSGWGRSVVADQQLDLSGFEQINAYEPEELILDCGAGAKRADIEKLLRQRGQHFAFEPPDFSALFGSKHAGTLGGMLACNLAGPRRIKAGAARDHVLGITAVSGRGELFKAGARVVKNVTGYDVPKLMAHSFGTLAAITQVIFKVLPKPETEETIVVGRLDDGKAVAVMSKAMQSACEVSGAAHVPGQGTYLRLEGIAASVVYRREALLKLLGHDAHVLPEPQSVQTWTAIRDVASILEDGAAMIWRLSITPSDAPSLLAALRKQFEFRCYLDWAGGLVWLSVPSTVDPDLIRSTMTSGHATLLRAPETVRTRVDVFHPQPEALAALSLRVKRSFDPDQRLNPGRMYKDV
jgi:glycolate oxidase FAD binding subunit